MTLALPLLALIGGLVLLVWSADRFVDGAAVTARYAGMSPLLIGMVVIGFGTSAPEMVVSAISASQGNPGLALGNAYGSNIANLALILGTTSLIAPIILKSSVIKKELSILLAVTVLAALLLFDLVLSRTDAIILLVVFAAIMSWWIWLGLRQRSDYTASDVPKVEPTMTLKLALVWLVIGMTMLVVSSRILVWGAVEIARGFGVSDLIIGLTVVAIGTSLPELAAAIIAMRKGEDDLAVGNVIGSNLFNTLAVVGIAGSIHPFTITPEVLYRDCLLMGLLTISLFFARTGKSSQKEISRVGGVLLLAVYFSYTGYLIAQVLGFI